MGFLARYLVVVSAAVAVAAADGDKLGVAAAVVVRTGGVTRGASVFLFEEFEVAREQGMERWLGKVSISDLLDRDRKN